MVLATVCILLGTFCYAFIVSVLFLCGQYPYHLLIKPISWIKHSDTKQVFVFLFMFGIGTFAAPFLFALSREVHPWHARRSLIPVGILFTNYENRMHKVN